MKIGDYLMFDMIFPSLSAIWSLSLLGLLFGLILSAAKIKLYVEKDPRIGEVEEALPGANCGACGLPGCSAYATRIVEEKYALDLCPVGGSEMVSKIAGIMGVETDASPESLKARVHCQGSLENTNLKFFYEGPRDCAASNSVMGGFKTCSYGCLGFGDCERACPFDAIHIGDSGLPVVIDEECVGCGKCVTACPRNIISLVPEKFGMHVMCMNEEKAPVMKKGCSVGCIACKLCEKACRAVFEDNPGIDTAIEVKNFNAEIDYDKCINCFKCVEVCPVPVIHPIERSNKKKKEREKEKAGSVQ